MKMFDNHTRYSLGSGTRQIIQEYGFFFCTGTSENFISPYYGLERLKLGTKRLLWRCLAEPDILFVRQGWSELHSVPFDLVVACTLNWLYTLEHSENLKM